MKETKGPERKVQRKADGVKPVKEGDAGKGSGNELADGFDVLRLMQSIGEKDADDQLRGEAPLPFPFRDAVERSPVVCDKPDGPEIPGRCQDRLQVFLQGGCDRRDRDGDFFLFIGPREPQGRFRKRPGAG